MKSKLEKQVNEIAKLITEEWLQVYYSEPANLFQYKELKRRKRYGRHDKNNRDM